MGSRGAGQPVGRRVEHHPSLTDTAAIFKVSLIRDEKVAKAVGNPERRCFSVGIGVESSSRVLAFQDHAC